MGYKILFSLNALVLIVMGAGLMFVPEMVLEQFQTQLRVTEDVQARYLGAAFITLGLVFWFVKAVSDLSLQKNLGAVGLMIYTRSSSNHHRYYKRRAEYKQLDPDRCGGCLRFRIRIYVIPETKNERIASVLTDRMPAKICGHSVC